MRLEGSLDAFSLPDIFTLLAMTKKTGALALRRPGAAGVVWLDGGELTGASADLSRQGLARRVLAAVPVEEAALQDAVAALPAGSGGGLVRALLDGGLADPDTVRELAREHVFDAVFDLLRWADGDFAFDAEAANPDDVDIRVSVEEVVAEGRQRLSDWADATAAVPSPAAVLSLCSVPPADPVVSRDEWLLLSLVDGRRTVRDLVDICGRGEFRTVTALAGLVSRGLLRGGDDSGVDGLLRRHAVLAGLESPPAAQPAAAALPAAVPVPDQAPAAPAPAADAGPVPAAEPVPEADPVVPTEPLTPAQPVAAAKPAPAPVAPAPRAPARDGEVFPARADVLPPRRAAEPVVLGSSAVAPAPNALTAIDRDPSINRSLLLRLIAGVRGL